MGYLPSQMGGGVPTLDGGGGTYLGWGGGTYLGWREVVPTLDGEGVPTLDGGRWYLPWMGEGVPTLNGGGYLPFTGYAAGGMPLAFMQEDCLVSNISCLLALVITQLCITSDIHRRLRLFL